MTILNVSSPQTPPTVWPHTSHTLPPQTQAKYGALARGDAAAFMRFPPPSYREKIWDHCAGAIIVSEAGGCITDAAGAPLNFGQGRFLTLDRGIVAAAPQAHARILGAIQDMKDEGVVPAC